MEAGEGAESPDGSPCSAVQAAASRGPACAEERGCGRELRGRGLRALARGLHARGCVHARGERRLWRRVRHRPGIAC